MPHKYVIVYSSQIVGPVRSLVVEEKVVDEEINMSYFQ
jgi:hypothetical protein